MRSGLILAIGIFSGCTVSPPRNIENACQLLAEKPGWYDAVNDAADSWDVSEGLILSFIRQESSFVSNAKPPRTKILGIIPGPRASSAYGYPQAKDGTWGDYRQATNSYLAVRDNFRDAADFVGWYVARAHRIAGISKSDAYRHYLAYHEGVGGFQRGTFKSKRWLMGVAKRVSLTAKAYETQLDGCREKIKSGSWWNPFN
ncbi:MAG: hypothetical protein CMD99_08615 [Gammaproteobacteria bacterium]|nr:hypothetical protein [Gammaproteobacteria bacterium]